jgi:hypothetical protein
MEQWYVMLLHDGRLPGALSNKPNTAFTSRLRDDAKERVPRLKWDLSDVMLKDFLTDPERIGIVCEKYRANTANGWTFPPLDEARAAWVRKYGPTDWQNPDAVEWYSASKPKPVAAAPAPAPQPVKVFTFRR